MSVREHSYRLRQQNIDTVQLVPEFTFALTCRNGMALTALWVERTQLYRTGPTKRLWSSAVDEMPIILLVEDDPSVQEFIKEALHEAGYDMTVSASAGEALSVLKSGVVKYRAIVTDVHLEGETNGWELARQTREIDPAFPVIYMTGLAAEQWASQGVPNSILLQKPFAPAQLVTAVSQLLNVTSTSTPSSLVGDR